MMLQISSVDQGLLADQFLYFFLRLRKSRIRKVVEAVHAGFPEESTQQKARRLIEAQVPLSFLGGAMMHLPSLVPGLGQALKFMGVVGGTAVITRMHVYLLLEIALLFGKDIEDTARVPEMLAIVAGTGLMAGLPVLADFFDVNPLLSLPAAGVTSAGLAKLIGECSISYYSKKTCGLSEAPAPVLGSTHAQAHA